MATNRKVVKYRKPFTINIGVILFVIVFIYIFIQVVIYFNTEHMSIYEVTEQEISDDNTYRGLILRSEKVYQTEKAGSVNYYVSEGSRVAKDDVIYSIDETGKIYDLLMNNETKYSLSDDDVKEVRDVIQTYRSNYNDANYSAFYKYKNSIENAVLNLNNVNMTKELNKLLKENGVKGSFNLVQSQETGIVSYIVDGFENLSEDKIKAEYFDDYEYKKSQLRTAEEKKAKSDVYKIITDEEWSIVISLSDEQYQKLKEQKRVRVTFLSDKREVSADFKTFDNNGKHYGTIELDRYMIQYLSDRYIDISIQSNSAAGYKLPVSSVTKKEFYKIPLEYVTTGGTSNATGVIQLVKKENGEQSTQFVEADKYYEDEDGYGYIDATLFKKGDTLLKPEKKVSTQQKKFEIKESAKLEGVFNVNKGYPVFRRVEILYENPEYYIVKKDTTYGVSAFDHIIIDAAHAIANNIAK